MQLFKQWFFAPKRVKALFTFALNNYMHVVAEYINNNSLRN